MASMTNDSLKKRKFALTEIALQNFKMFRSSNMHLEPDLTLLVGDNGSGKSTILEAMRIAVGSFFIKLGAGASQSIPKSAASQKTYRYDNDIRFEELFPVEVSAKGFLDGMPVSWERSLTTNKSRTTRVGASSIMRLTQEWQRRIQEGDETLILPLLSYYGTNRLWKPSNVSAKGKIEKQGRLAGYEGSLDTCIDYELMKNWFYRKAFLEFSKKTESRDYRIVRTMISSALEKLIPCENANIAYDVEHSDICITYTDNDGIDRFYEVASLSDGYRNILILLSDIAFRMALLNPMLGDSILTHTPGIVLIDEVDLHLHPKWQSLILPLLTDSFPEVQFVATTHSPIVVSSIQSRSIRLLEAGESYLMPRETYGSNVETVLSSVMDTKSRVNDIADSFAILNELLAKRDIQGAEKLINQLGEIVGNADPDLVAYEMSLELIKIEDADAIN